MVLVLPRPRVERQTREAFGKKRVSYKTAGFATASAEYILRQVLAGIKAELDADPAKRTRASVVDFTGAIRDDVANPELARLFSNFAITQSMGYLKPDPDVFLTKADQKKHAEKRAEASKARKAAAEKKKADAKAAAEKAAEEAIPEIDVA